MLGSSITDIETQGWTQVFKRSIFMSGVKMLRVKLKLSEKIQKEKWVYWGRAGLDRRCGRLVTYFGVNKGQRIDKNQCGCSNYETWFLVQAYGNSNNQILFKLVAVHHPHKPSPWYDHSIKCSLTSLISFKDRESIFMSWMFSDKYRITYGIS